MKFGVGQPVPRLEDPRLITGAGAFTDDVNLPGQLYLAMARSPYAHGQLGAVDCSEARAAEGVRAVYTAADIEALGGMPCRAVLSDRQGNPCFIPKRPLLAEGRVRFAGEPVAAVIAETPQQARDAAELIFIDVDDLPSAPPINTTTPTSFRTVRPWLGVGVCGMSVIQMPPRTAVA